MIICGIPLFFENSFWRSDYVSNNKDDDLINEYEQKLRLKLDELGVNYKIELVNEQFHKAWLKSLILKFNDDISNQMFLLHFIK